MTADRFESELRSLHAKLDAVLEVVRGRPTVKEFYSTQEVAGLLGRDMFTVREWARLGRIHAVKRATGRGSSAAWAIPHHELERIRNHGLLPDPRRGAD
jgi:hypothetical protein